MYRGSCRYDLLCKNGELKTIGWKLLDHKLYNTNLIKTVNVELTRVEEWNPTATDLLQGHNDNLSQESTKYDSDITEIYEQTGNPLT